MIKRLLVISTGPKAGKLLVILGLMEILTRRLGRVSFFRPVVDLDHPRQDLPLILSRYAPHQRPEEALGLRAETLKEKAASQEIKEVLGEIISRVEELEKGSDFVLLEGLNTQGFLATFEREINLGLAQNLGAAVVSVVDSRGLDLEELHQVLKITHDSVLKKGLAHLAIFANRVEKGLWDLLGEETHWLGETPVFFLPEVLELDRPTLLDLQEKLGAEQLLGRPEDLDRIIKRVKIASMTTENFLNYLEEGDLIITAGDREDILLASLMSLASPHFPKISGLLLTGGLKPGPNVSKLLKEKQTLIPILGLPTDTYTSTQEVNQLTASLSLGSPRKLALALGTFEENVPSETIVRQLEITSTEIITPVMFEHGLFEKARRVKKHIVLPEGDDERILRAAEILLRRKSVAITLLGNPEEIKTRAEALGLKLDEARCLDPEKGPLREELAQALFERRREKGLTLPAAYDLLGDFIYFGTMMVYAGYADGLVSGARHTTADTIRPALQIIKTKPGYSLVSSLFFMCLPTRVLVYADCAINPDPKAEELAEIAIASAETAALFGINPKVALLSYSTGSSGKGKDVEKVRLATEIVKKRRPELPVEGPIQYDAAIDPEVAQVKLPQSEVAGAANVFIFPDLNAGNNAYKAVQRAVGAVAIGPILQGLRKPVNDLSRGCSVQDVINTVVITAIQAQGEGSP